MPEDHYTILAASENLDKALARTYDKVNSAKMSDIDRLEMSIHLGMIEGIAIFLRDRANIIAETQP